jgi:hypothetical protein
MGSVFSILCSAIQTREDFDCDRLSSFDVPTITGPHTGLSDSDFEDWKVVGKGACGVVFLATHLPSAHWRSLGHQEDHQNKCRQIRPRGVPQYRQVPPPSDHNVQGGESSSDIIAAFFRLIFELRIPWIFRTNGACT